MSCYFAATGKRFDVDGFLAGSSLGRVAEAVRRGEAVIPGSKRFTKRYPVSGFTVRLGSRHSWKLDPQVSAARRFLRTHLPELRRLSEADGLERRCIDFGVAADSAGVSQSFRLPLDLISLAADARVSLEISVYPVSTGADRHRKRGGGPTGSPERRGRPRRRRSADGG